MILRRFFRRFFLGLLFCSGFFAVSTFPAVAQPAEDAPLTEEPVRETHAANTLSDEQVRKLVTLAKLLEHREFSTIANALRYADAKIPSFSTDTANYRFLKTLAEYGLAKQNTLPSMPGISAQAQNSLSSYSIPSRARETVADILKVAKPGQAAKIDAYLSEQQ